MFTNIPSGDNNMTITCTSTSSGATLSRVLSFTIMGKDIVILLAIAKQKHPGCKKRRGQSEAAVIK